MAGPSGAEPERGRRQRDGAEPLSVAHGGVVRRWWVAALLLLALAAAVYGPALGLQLTGDDYQHVQAAHLFLLHPGHPFPPVGQWFRPLTTWTLALDLAVWGHRPSGFHLSNLLYGLGAALLLAAAARRLGLRPVPAWLVAGLWLVSPFADEAMIWVAIRHELFLLAAWLALVLAWPRSGEAWTRGRAAAAAACVAAAVLSKETWVVTPGIVLVLAWVRQGWRWRRRMLVPVALTTALALVYVGVRFALVPGTGGYFVLALRPLLKLPAMLAAFLRLGALSPGAFRLQWTGVLALAAVAVLVAAGLRRRVPAVVVGAALLVLPLAPVALVPYLPQRYALIPYAGFLLMALGAADELLRRLGPASPRRALGLGLAGLLVAAGVAALDVATVRRDLEDWQRIAGWHEVLLEEARRVVGAITPGRPVAVVRGERRSPLAETSGQLRGMPKVLYVRREDPYGLVDAAALFEWVAAKPDLVVTHVDGWERRCAGVPGEVLVHREGGFERIGPVPDLAAAAGGWKARGAAVRVIEARRGG